MASIREYIDLIEAAFLGNEPRPFGRKGVSPDPDTRGTPPADSGQLERAREFPTAHAYATDTNFYHPIFNHDPPHIKAKHDKEYDRLSDEWRGWKQAGLL